MTQDEILRICEEKEVLLTGHFLLRSGLHSDKFFQAALILQYPDIAEKLCKQLAENISNANISADAVISPAVGGLIVGQEIARQLGIRAIFADKKDNRLILKRGFKISKGEKFIVAEDVVTKGGRVYETIELVKKYGGVVSCVAVIADRSEPQIDFGTPLFNLLKIKFNTYPPEECPLCKNNIPVEQPGSK